MIAKEFIEQIIAKQQYQDYVELKDRESIGSKTFDMIVVTSHNCARCLEDIRFALNHLNKDGMVVALGSCPANESQQSMHKQGDNWVGRTWQAIAELMQRPQPSVVTVDVDGGVSIIRPSKNKCQVNLYKPGSSLLWWDYKKNKDSYLNIMDPNIFLKTLKKKRRRKR